MFDLLPGDATELTAWSWAEFEPYYSDLNNRSLTADSLKGFLADWTRVSELMDEAFSRLHVATTINTIDKEAEKKYHHFLDQVYPKAEEAEQRLREKLLVLRIRAGGSGNPFA